MKFPRLQTFSFCSFFCGLFVWLNPSVEARIGESRDSLERRLLNAGGIVYRDDVVESNRRRNMPYMKFLEFMPDSTDLRIYYKTIDGRKPKSSDMEEQRVHPGWDIHVLYVRGVSMLEVYKRSQPMTDPEMKLLLATLAQGSYWKKVDKTATEEAEGDSAFGFDMERHDGKVRGKKIGQTTVMIFDSALDIRLAEMRVEDDQERAPASVNGF
ncbi:MAG: hypothetical protein ACON39_00245 [Coraliomargaritaceae bacterium]